MGTTRLNTMPGLDRIGAADAAGTTGLVIGGGGMGKSRLLDDLAERGRERGHRVLIVGASPFGAPVDLPAEDCDLLLVDDAQFLDPASTAELVRIAEDRNRTFDLCVAMRSVGHNPALGRLAEVAERRGVLIELGPYNEQELGAVLSAHVDGAVDASLFDAVKRWTCGHPLLVDRLISGWVRDGHLERGRLIGDPDPAPSTVERALLGPVGQLEPEDRAVLAALALATDDPGTGQRAIHDLGSLVAHGFVLADGAMPPAVAHAVRRVLDPAELAEGELLLASELARTGADPVTIAEHFFATSASGAAATRAWIDAGDELLDTDPEAAAVWYGRANQTEPAADTLARRAVALAAAGDETGANQAIADVLRSEPRNPRTLGAGAQLAAVHGRWVEAAELLEAIDSHPRWSLPLIDAMNDAALLIAGRRPSSGSPSASADPAAATIERAVAALRISLEPIPDTAALTEAIRSLATRVGAAPGGPDLAVNAFELGAVSAVAAGELQMAELLLDSARASLTDCAGTSLHNWLQVRIGGVPRDDTEAFSLTESPYAGLFDLAAEALQARRAGDVAAGAAVLDRLRQVVALAPIDVLTIDAAAELLILAHRFGSRTVRETLAERIERFLLDHDTPPLWTARVRWAELEAAVGTRNLDLARRAADALKELGPTGPRLTPLIDAAAVWIEVLEERCEMTTVLTMADELEQSGHRNDAALLVGQAAIRMPIAEDAKRLLNRARELRGQATPSMGDDNTTPSGLSEREIEVAELILDGHSYKEIGSRLFISAKTVEHHASHIRRKLDAVGMPRAAFLAALRTDLHG